MGTNKATGGGFAPLRQPVLIGPTWQAIDPELVPREDVKGAVALNSLGINIARSIGPAADGLLPAAFGAAVTYGADVASYILVIAALIWWPRAALSENFFGALRAGLRYTRASKPLHVVLLRTAIFFAFASAVWALLPLVARQLLGGNASFYGLLLAAVGAGAIGGALIMPKLREQFDSDALLLGAAIITALVMGALSFAPPQWLAVVILLFLGASWITALTTLNGAAQAVLPHWVRGRGLAVYVTVFNGAMTAGSLGWGAVGEAVGVPAMLLIGAAGLLVAGFIMHRVKLPTGDADLVSSNHWPEPLVAEPVAHDRGPVLILIDYHVAKQYRTQYLHALDEMSSERRRDRAYGGGVTEDSAIEWFMVESWAEHLRQHKRVSKADADLQARSWPFTAVLKSRSFDICCRSTSLEEPPDARHGSNF